MLTVPQIEALRQTNPQLYESLKRLAGASLGPNQGWSLDNQITDGTVSTTSSLTWSWSGLTIYRADGTTTAIPSGSVAVTGLTAATTYYFYPYWDDTASALAWVAGGAGAPANAQTAK